MRGPTVCAGHTKGLIFAAIQAHTVESGVYVSDGAGVFTREGSAGVVLSPPPQADRPMQTLVVHAKLRLKKLRFTVYLSLCE